MPERLQLLLVEIPELLVCVQLVSTVLQEVLFQTSILPHQALTLLQERLQLLYVQLELTILFITSQYVLLAQLATIATVQECLYQQFARQDLIAQSVHKALLFVLSELTIQYWVVQVLR